MIDLKYTIVPNSQQLNSDDLLVESKTITITGVKVNNSDQPVSIEYKEEGMAWLPCKSMMRVMISQWGSDGTTYVGKSLILYNDPTITFGPMAVGGIRIESMSDIDKDFKINLTKSRGKKAPFSVKLLQIIPLKGITDDELKLFTADMDGAENMADLKLIGAKISDAGFDEPGTKKLTVAYREASKKLRDSNQGE